LKEKVEPRKRLLVSFQKAVPNRSPLATGLPPGYWP
jgi:hypothetical protein